MSRPRVAYKTFVVERYASVPRDVVWNAFVDLLERSAPGVSEREASFRLGEWALTERTLSFEPPWRRVYEISSGAPVKLYQATTALRDDGATTLLVWSYLCEPLDDGGSDQFLEQVQRALTRVADLVIEAATA